MPRPQTSDCASDHNSMFLIVNTCWFVLPASVFSFGLLLHRRDQQQKRLRIMVITSGRPLTPLVEVIGCNFGFTRASFSSPQTSILKPSLYPSPAIMEESHL
ncbi:unnamed protein product [Choristocarpus tenellus]